MKEFKINVLKLSSFFVFQTDEILFISFLYITFLPHFVRKRKLFDTGIDYYLRGRQTLYSTCHTLHVV